jgi:hypothetical protein
MDVVVPTMPSTGFGIPRVIAFAAPVSDATSVEEVTEGGLGFESASTPCWS